jgi:ABC transporter DrrB family efflux protein
MTAVATPNAPTGLRPVPAGPAPATAGGVSQLWNHSLVFAGRHLAHIRQIPEKLLDVTIQPLMFVLLFAYVFGGAIAVSGGNYREYLMGGILVQSLTFGLVGPATSIATDLTEGVLDRFRSLPSTRLAYLLGHYLAELAGMLLAISILIGTGFVVGWRAHGSIVEIVLALGLLVLFASAMIWLGTLLGLLVRAPDAVMGIAFTIIFPLTFVSNAFVPIDTLPTVLQRFAEWNPVSIMVEAVRDLFGNSDGAAGTQSWALEHSVVIAFAYGALLLMVMIPVSLRRLRARTSD